MGCRGRQIFEFEASLFYRVSTRTARAIQRNPVSENKNKKQKTKIRTTKSKTRGRGSRERQGETQRERERERENSRVKNLTQKVSTHVTPW